MSKIKKEEDRVMIDGEGTLVDTSGHKQLFDSGLKFDSGLYYDKWGVDPKQGETPDISK